MQDHNQAAQGFNKPSTLQSSALRVKCANDSASKSFSRLPGDVTRLALSLPALVARVRVVDQDWIVGLKRPRNDEETWSHQCSSISHHGKQKKLRLAYAVWMFHQCDGSSSELCKPARGEASVFHHRHGSILIMNPHNKPEVGPNCHIWIFVPSSGCQPFWRHVQHQKKALLGSCGTSTRPNQTSHKEFVTKKCMASHELPAHSAVSA
mmetsp:Transcript_28812/g.52222  ORF Transcript_28812/g.52222 Transcript_28812/m.52222 type:complete len:208 (-) Transcript_28812:123-746(-)